PAAGHKDKSPPRQPPPPRQNKVTHQPERTELRGGEYEGGRPPHVRRTRAGRMGVVPRCHYIARPCRWSRIDRAERRVGLTSSSFSSPSSSPPPHLLSPHH